MNAVCHLTLVPVRAEPSDKSEMVTQLLFGETVAVLEEKGNWLLARLLNDGYIGWIDRKQVLETETALPEDHAYITPALVTGLIGKAIRESDRKEILLLKGSVLDRYDSNTFWLGSEKHTFEGSAKPFPAKFEKENIVAVAEQYLTAPYLWGGRSIAGIDCSGLVQAVFRECGRQLPRDAAEQSQVGEAIDFIEETQPGDLAFFNNAAGEIIHVGIIKQAGAIIHASGEVRTDRIDHHGIFNSQTNAYSHTLRIIRRIS